jgi:hypothetical protein
MRGLLLPVLPILLLAQSQAPAQISSGASWPDWIMALFTLALAVLAGAQFWAMYRQAEYMRRGLAETKRAANAAASASATTKLALEISNRANVGIESIVLRDPWPVGTRRIENRAARSFIEVTIKNYGATPAKEMSFEFRVLMPPYIGEPVPIVSRKTELHSLCSSPSAFKPIHEISGEFFKNADANMFLRDLRVDGYIRYKDVFGHGYYVECAATFDPTGWEFEVVTTVRSDSQESAI